MISYLFLFVCILAIAIGLFLEYAPTLWWKIQWKRLKKIQALPYFKNWSFRNNIRKQAYSQQENTSIFWGVKDFLFPKKWKNPKKPLPSKKFDAQNFTEWDMVWFGHSTILFQTDGKNILTDPVFNRASPIPIFGKEFPVTHKTQISDLPDIDAVIISHDHYDHLDYNAIIDLSPKTKKFFVPLWVWAHLERWWIEQKKIVELEWYESSYYEDITFSLTPTQHFSGRWMTNRNSTLWWAWVIQSQQLNAYFSWDTGYSQEFVNVWKKYWPFDIAFLENGAYNSAWADIHMLPEQSVQAGIDLNANVLFPIHWSKFDLSSHVWDEPITRFTAEATKKQKKYTTPLIGQIFSLKNMPQEKWWKNVQ